MSKNLSDIFPPTEIGGGGGGGIEEAPKTGKMYARKDAAWEEFATGNLDDGNQDGEILTWDTASAEWTHDNTMIVKGGNVGIGVSPSVLGGYKTLHIGEDNVAGGALKLTSADGKEAAVFNFSGTLYAGGETTTMLGTQLNGSFKNMYRLDADGTQRWLNVDDGSTNMNLSNDGRLGIGMNPLRSTAKEQLAEWKASFDARLKTEPKADKKAVTLEITDDAFEVLPTEEALAEWMETRAAGDRLQVNGSGSFSGAVRADSLSLTKGGKTLAFNANVGSGNSSSLIQADTGMELHLAANKQGGQLKIDTSGDAHFSGTVNADKEIRTDFFLKTNAWRSKDNKSGLFLSGSSINPINYADGGQNGTSDGETSLGSADSRFKDAHFSGTVRAGAFASPNNGYGVIINSSGQISPCVDLDNLIFDQGSVTHTIGTNRNGGKFKDGWFSGTVNADKFVGDGSGLTGVGGGLPPGDFTHNGKITATDFIATSDERAKDNITTAPTGVLEQLHGREWDWKESGEKGSGVVAQELEQVLPHLVHEDDDGMKSVAYNGLVAYLIEEVKALRAEVEALK
jgi:hypothetical protein